MNQQTVNELSGTALEFAFAKALKYEVMGTPSGPFALHATEDLKLHVVGADVGSVVCSSFFTDLAEIPLELGKELGADLYVNSAGVKCHLQGITTEGENYLQALLRALVLYYSSKESHQ